MSVNLVINSEPFVDQGNICIGVIDTVAGNEYEVTTPVPTDPDPTGALCQVAIAEAVASYQSYLIANPPTPPPTNPDGNV